MLKEHLIEPEFLLKVVKTRRDAKDLEREFTLPSPRVPGNFPKLKNFRRQVLRGQSVDAPEHERMRLEVLLRLLSERRVERDLDYDGSIDFKHNLKVIEEHAFRGVHLIAERNPAIDLTSEIISIEEFRDGLDPSVSQLSVTKLAEDLCNALREFVRLSSSITLVDPYFGTKPQTWKTFLLLLEASIESAPSAGKTFHVLFDGSKATGRSCRYLAETLKREKPDLVKEFLDITFKDIRENGNSAVHNRYLMSELGGVSIGHGFEESNERESDDVTILDKAVYQKRFSEFVELAGVHLEDQFSLK